MRAHQLWAMVHGVSSLVLVNLLTPDEGLSTLAKSGRHLPISFGDDPAAYDRSLATALERAAT